MDREERIAQNRQAWKDEHKNPILVAMASGKESSALVNAMAIMRLKPGSSILDIGCGNGRNSLWLAKQKEGFLVSGFDLSGEAISIARQQAIAQQLDISLQIATMDESWPYGDNSFDCIVDSTASCSVGDLSGIVFAIAETYRVLKPGGYAVVISLADTDPYLQRYERGEEPKTLITPSDELHESKIEKVYSPEEVVTAYSQFNVVFQELRSTNVTYGDKTNWDRQTIFTLLQKQPLIQEQASGEV